MLAYANAAKKYQFPCIGTDYINCCYCYILLLATRFPLLYKSRLYEGINKRNIDGREKEKNSITKQLFMWVSEKMILNKTNILCDTKAFKIKNKHTEA